MSAKVAQYKSEVKDKKKKIYIYIIYILEPDTTGT